MLPHSTRLRSLLLLCLLVFVAGCVRETTAESNHKFRYEFWVTMSLLVGGIVAATAGWFLRERSARLGWILLIAGPLAAVLGAPSMFLDYVTVNEQGFSRRSGIWGMTANCDVLYDDIQQARLISEESRGRRGRKVTSYYLVCTRKDGSQTKLSMGNQLVDAAAPLITQKLREHGISFIDISQ